LAAAVVSETGHGDGIGLTSRQGYHPASSPPLNVATTSSIPFHSARGLQPCILDRPWIRRPPLENLVELRAIEQEILQGIDELEGML
jgi:hypothetical protein